MKQENILRERFTARLTQWWGEEADIAGSVDELMTDLGYVTKKPSMRRVDPVAYSVVQREYMRKYMRDRRANKKAGISKITIEG